MSNITLLGAGSASFAIELIRDLCDTDDLAGSRMTLMDIDESRLEVARTLAERYRDEIGADLSFESTTSRQKALEGAEFVICAVKVGGYGPLEKERKIAEERGYYRGVGDRVSCYWGGIGAYHQFTFLLELARDMERYCPDAWLVQTANPVFDGTNIVTRQTKVKAVGICHGHFMVKRLIDAIGLDESVVSAHMAGVNHYIWLTSLFHREQDAYPLIDDWIENQAPALWETGEYNEQLSPGAVDAYRLYGLFPIGDTVRSGTPWWHHVDFATKERWYGTDGGFDSEVGWNRYLDKKVVQGRELAELAKDPEASIRERFKPTGRNEQHIPFVRAVAANKETKLQLNVPNKGALPGVADDVLVEIPALVNKTGIQNLMLDPMPAKVMNQVITPRILAMENLYQAYVEHDRTTLVLMVANDPRTQSFEQAKELVDTLLAQPWNKKADMHYR